MITTEFKTKVTTLIDNLKGVTGNYGLGNDGNEFKIITQVFLYKFLNDKFAYEVKQLRPKIAKAESWEQVLKDLPEEDYEMLLLELDANTPQLRTDHFISHLFDIQNKPNFAKNFDDTLMDIAALNNDIFSVKSEEGVKVRLFERLSDYINDSGKRDAFCKAIINKLVDFSFEEVFTQKYDFFATIFEYLIKDYNTDSGGKYAEYYTPHAVAKIMAAILVKNPKKVRNVTCYDPSAGSGTLLMDLAHAIGEDRCTIYSQDISQKSSSMLRLNLILNNLVHSIQNIIQGNTLENPYHKEGGKLMQFDYIVSNPPFKLDFSDYIADLDTKANTTRFFAGFPNIPKKDKNKMAIYPLFIQHIIYSLTKKGKAAIVVPTGFLTAQSKIEKNIRKKLIDEKMLLGVVSMPSNIFATTGTNVSILFLDTGNKEDIVLMDASKLGTVVKEGKNQKTVLTEAEEELIVNTFNQKKEEEDLSVVVKYKDIEEKNYSFSAGQYFEIKIEYVKISKDEFSEKISSYNKRLKSFFKESKKLESDIIENIKRLNYE